MRREAKMKMPDLPIHLKRNVDNAYKKCYKFLSGAASCIKGTISLVPAEDTCAQINSN